MVAEEIGQGNEIILSIIGQGNELKEFSKKLVAEESDQENEIMLSQGNKQLKMVWKINLKEIFYILKQIKKVEKVE